MNMLREGQYAIWKFRTLLLVGEKDKQTGVYAAG